VDRSETPGRYVYCLALAGEAHETEEPGLAGIEGRAVEAVGCGEIVALAHRGSDVPYSGSDEQAVVGWVLAHHHVVEEAWKRWGSVLPMSFNTIVVGADGDTPEERLRGWIETEREPLLLKLRTLRGRAEYGVQVFWDEAHVARVASERSLELEAQIAASPRGMAFMLTRKREALLRREAEDAAAKLREWVSGRVAAVAEQVQTAPLRGAETGHSMVVNLSCLASRTAEPELAALVGELAAREGHQARLVGPLPPYSFA
jgi:hypothetical protein